MCIASYCDILYSTVKDIVKRCPKMASKHILHSSDEKNAAYYLELQTASVINMHIAIHEDGDENRVSVRTECSGTGASGKLMSVPLL